MTITAALVKELRERTGAGMMDCKKALVETNANLEAAIDLMRASGASKAAKKAGRVASEGLVNVAISADKINKGLAFCNKVCFRVYLKYDSVFVIITNGHIYKAF